jgi:hypothetical protein
MRQWKIRRIDCQLNNIMNAGIGFSIIISGPWDLSPTATLTGLYIYFGEELRSMIIRLEMMTT